MRTMTIITRDGKKTEFEEPTKERIEEAISADGFKMTFRRIYSRNQFEIRWWNQNTGETVHVVDYKGGAL